MVADIATVPVALLGGTRCGVLKVVASTVLRHPCPLDVAAVTLVP